MQVDLEKIKKLPPDVRKDFMKMALKLNEKKKISKVNSDFLSFTKHIWPEFIEGEHHKIIAKKFTENLYGLGLKLFQIIQIYLLKQDFLDLQKEILILN